jgi:hypothetical protein
MSKVGKKRGNRPGRRSVRVVVRLEWDQAARLDRWRKGLTGNPKRPEAMRRLIEHALPGSHRGHQISETVHKASELAAKTIESLADKSRPPTERARAKRRLIHGPREFRNIRADLPNQKG